MITKNSKVHIDITEYRKIINQKYTGSTDIDEKLGLEFDITKEYWDKFTFRVTDINKFLLAKIKYCI